MKLYKSPYSSVYINLDNVVKIHKEDRLVVFQLSDGSTHYVNNPIGDTPAAFDEFMEQFSPRAEFNKKLEEIVG